MSGTNTAENEFLGLLNGEIEKNLSNNQFGVEELAGVMNMSRSNLLRKVKKVTGLSVNQLISQARLAKAMELLKTTSMNVSEVSYQVGFSSTSYFIKCFKERYGFSPGKKTAGQANVENEPQKFRLTTVVVVVASVVLIASGVFFFFPARSKITGEKSIAILPFKNESSDSSNVYLINGLMESTLNNLQQIHGLRVTSRTTSEKYRNTGKSIPEMAKELGVNYFIEGSGQKIGDKILLNIQLIEAATDKHLWAKQYRSESSDIFELQHEIAKNIADEIEVVITPEVERRIAKKPTNNIVAYDYFLKGKDSFYKSSRKSLSESLPYFRKAVEYDNSFALAYGTAAMVYYYLDMYQLDKKYVNDLDSCADRAVALDPMLPESLLAKGLSYAARKEYDDAVVYFEKAHEADPNSALVIHFLTEFYSIHVFNSAKYLEYALKGLRIDLASPVDSSTTSFKYFHLANAFAQGGFIDEAELYVDKSLGYNPNNPFGRYFRAYVLFAKDHNIKRTRDLLIVEYRKDSMRLDIMQEIAKLYYLERDYKNSQKAYSKFMDLRRMMGLDVYDLEAIRMADTWRALGYKKEAEDFANYFKTYADKDKSIYHHLHLSSYYAYRGDKKKMNEEFKKFVDEDYYFHYWVLLIEYDPMMIDVMKDDPEFKENVKMMTDNFWRRKEEIRKSLQEKGLL